MGVGQLVDRSGSCLSGGFVRLGHLGADSRFVGSDPLPAATTPGGGAPAALQPGSPGADVSSVTAGATFTGMAFDTCAGLRYRPCAPGSTRLIVQQRYIGGSMRACGDGNLSASWVAQVRAMGWRLIPTYVGPQARYVNQSGLATISSTAASAQGTANANDAVSRARHFGMCPGTPIYNDMEGYRPSASCSRTVRTFISAWASSAVSVGDSS
jgi:hypothetical protein